jgi:hypothetical protein
VKKTTTSVPSNSDPSHDDLIKALLLQPRLLRELFRAFVPESEKFADLSRIEYLDKEHPRNRRRGRRAGDVLVKVKWKGKPVAFLIHIECQSSPDGSILLRVVEYAMQDSQRYGLPVMPVVLLTYPGGTPVKGSLDWKFGTVAAIQVQCPVLQFAQMNPQEMLRSGNVAALAMASLTKMDSEEKLDLVVETLAQSIRQKLSPAERAAALAFIEAYVQLQDEEVLKLRARADTLSKQNPEFRTMPKLVNPFVRYGEIQGEIRGRAEGRSQGELLTIQRQLARKFPTVSTKVASGLKKLDEETLLSFGEALLFMQQPKECAEWLKQHS